MAMKRLIGSNPWIGSNSSSAISRVCSRLLVSYYSASSSSSSSADSLDLRISRIGDRKASVVPVINQWLHEGKPIHQSELRSLIRKLRSFRRFHHALQISEWMSEELNRELSIADICARLDLTSKVRGVDQAEKLFYNLPNTMRNSDVYVALLKCYANNKCVEKAEATMKTIKDLEYPLTATSYNVLLKLYSQLGRFDKVDVVMQDMRDKGIEFDSYTVSIPLNAFVSSSDIEGMEKFLAALENDPQNSMDWHAYVVAANGYLKVGSDQKAMQMLNRAEQLAPSKTPKQAYEVLLTLYANLKRKDDVCRVWKLYESLGDFHNHGYLCMIHALIKLNDLDGAAKILAEWESGYKVYDGRIPKFMISAYCKKGLVEKAEGLIERSLIGEPDAFTLNGLAVAYHQNGMMGKAVETMKKAILASTSTWSPNCDTLAACLRYLKGQNNIQAAKELLQLLRTGGHFSTEVYDRLSVALKGSDLDVALLTN